MRYAFRFTRCLLVVTGLAAVSSLSSCETQHLPSSGPPVASCCEERGACLPPSLLGPRELRLLGSETCEQAAICVPYELTSAEPPPRCTVSALGAEGRCLPGCLPSVAQAGARLTQETCAEHQRCVPCYDPATGASSEACSVGDDIGPTELPKTLEHCCNDLGRCAPTQFVPSSQQPFVGPDTCDGPTLCVPAAALVHGESFVPSPCTSPALARPGICVPACLPVVALLGSAAQQGSCPVQHACVPAPGS